MGGSARVFSDIESSSYLDAGYNPGESTYWFRNKSLFCSTRLGGFGGPSFGFTKLGSLAFDDFVSTDFS